MYLLGCFVFAFAAPPEHDIAVQLQERFGLNESQVQGALAALLVFARDRLPKPEFDAEVLTFATGVQRLPVIGGHTG